MKFPSLPSVLNTILVNNHWIFSNAISTSICIIIWFLFFSLLRWWISVIFYCKIWQHLSLVSVCFSVMKYFHTVVQPLPLSTPGTFPHPEPRLCARWTALHRALPPVSGHHCSAFLAACFCVSVSIGHLTSSLEKWLFKFFAHFFVDLGFLFSCWILGVLFVFWILIPYPIWFANVFPHSVGCLFTKVFNFDELQCVNLFYLWLWCHISLISYNCCIVLLVVVNLLLCLVYTLNLIIDTRL